MTPYREPHAPGCAPLGRGCIGYHTDAGMHTRVTICSERRVEPVRITLDVPPSANAYWRHNRGRTHRSHEANAYRDYVALLCQTAGVEPVDGEVSVSLAIYRPAKRGDLDNFFKQIFDSLQGHFYHNDSQIVAIHATRHDDPQCPRVEIEVTQL